MADKKYVRILVDDDGCASVELHPKQLYTESDLIAILHIMRWEEVKSELQTKETKK